jgi:hypothetical protein
LDYPARWRSFQTCQRQRIKPHEWRSQGLPIIRIQNLNGSDDFNYFDGSYNRKIEVHAGQLLFAWSGSRGTSFGPYIWHGPTGVLNYHTWKVALRRLFESRTGWPGTRHARLATAYAVDGDLPEAYVHARRADRWQRWFWDQDERARFHLRVDTEDFVGVAFYLVAKGRLTKAVRYLGQWRDAYSYEVASRLFEICKVSHSLGKLPKLHEVLHAFVRCAQMPPSVIVAMMTAFPDLDTAASKKLLSRLAKALLERPALGDYPPEFGKSDSYSLGLQRCSLRAAHLGLGTEAASILRYVRPRHCGLWTLRDPFSTRYILPWVLSVAVSAATESRTATLSDCLPSELWELVSTEPTPDSDAGQRDLLEKKLREEPVQNAEADKQKKQQLSESDRRQARDRLESRIIPIVALARHLAAILVSNDDECDAALASFFEGWKAALTAPQKDDWYPNDTARYLDNLYSNCALHTLIALNMFTPRAGAAFVEWVQRSEFVSTDLCIDLVRHFAMQKTTGEFAGRIAVQAVKQIEAEDDVQHRSNLMARLARAVLLANRNEATVLFSRGLSELDAIGSGDQAFTNELLNFGKSLPAAMPLQSESAHRLAKICELNLYDSHKFPWPLAAAAFTRVWGAAYLAQITRWHDRGKVDLELTLPCALSSLVRDHLIFPEDAVGLLRLVDPVESWDWDWDILVEAVIEVGSKDLAAILNEVLAQFELAHPRRPPASSLKKMREVLERHPGALALVKSQLERLERRATQSRRLGRELSKQNYIEADMEAAHNTAEQKEQRIASAVECTDPLSPASIESLAAALDGIEGGVDTKSRAFKLLREKVNYADQSPHIEAVVSARNIELFAKNKILKGIKADWLAASPSQLGCLRSAAGRLVREHAASLVGKEWGFSWELNELAEITGQPREDLAVGLVEAATSRELETAATTWLNIASVLAKRADENIPRAALERLLNSGAARLADDVGDGAWKPALDVGSDPVAIVAGLIWFCLGSPLAANRWRAAHAVRTLVRFGRWKVIDALFNRFDLPDVGAFQDTRLPFFIMYARQWFLLAIARIAIDFPTEVARYVKKLEVIAFDEAFPHVALREAADRALSNCLVGNSSKAADALKRRLREIHVSKFSPKETSDTERANFEWNRPKDAPEPEPRFYFDYDFDKYDLARLGKIFGLPKWKIGDQCVTWIHRWDPNITSMYDFGGRDRPTGYSDYAKGSGESFQCYGAYLARNALAVEGGRLLLTAPINKGRYTYDTWEEWISHYSPTRPDGLWLADGTGKHPDFSLHDLKAVDPGGKERPLDDPLILSSLVGIDSDGKISEALTVDGLWSSPDGVSVLVSSSLVSTGESQD